MADQQTVLTEVRERVGTLTINRPDRLNALNTATREAIIGTLADWERSDDVRVVVITGAGPKAFIAGADINEFADRSAVDQFRVMRQMTVFESIDRFPKPILASINGFCLGGGCELAMACDIRIAAESAKLGQPEINLGILPGGGGTQRLPRLVGMGNAFRMLYTGEIITAQEAHRIGLVDHVVPAEQLQEYTQTLALSIAQKSPVALQLIREAVRASARTPLDEGLRLETTLFGMAFSSEDKTEGVDAFLTKRPPNFKGR